MIILAIVLLAISSIGIIGATLLEMRYHEPKYKVMMKIFPWVFGIGAVILGIVVAGG